MSTSAARSAKTLYPAALIFSRRSSSVVMRRGSTEWMRKGSMIVLKRSATAAPMLVRGRSFADATDRLGKATGPGLTVSRQDEGRVEALELRERLASAREVRPERRELRSGLSGQDVKGREGVVIDVGVRQHERANVGHRSAHCGELCREIVPVAGRAGVDDRDLTAFLEEVRVDEAAAEAVDPGRDLHCAFRFGSAVAATAS